MVSTMKRRDERQRSANPVWNMSPDAREHQNEQAKGSRQQRNNADVMLTIMEHNMKERDY